MIRVRDTGKENRDKTAKSQTPEILKLLGNRIGGILNSSQNSS